MDAQGVATVTLNRPEIHNAFNDKLIEELRHVFFELNQNIQCRLAILTGEGKSFCAGADLNWMKSMVEYSKSQNIEDSRKLAKMFETIDNFSKPLIGKVNGHALGGGVGLAAVCDYVLASERAKFGFTEARLGLVPAVISPFCINKIGVSNARAWFLSGELFNTQKAFEMGLVHEVCSLEELDTRLESLIKSFLKAGPSAAVASKALIKNVTSLPGADIQEYTLERIAELRVSEEGQEGMQALLNKTKPSWVVE
ncbi:MAG: enoyl-CoA hydratase/isomerase family protein [Bacteriovoracaceae bacterium]|nr:enoyl-CoA hydratase/isomerase family protein [Bacteriovoracaceae bacterium]